MLGFHESDDFIDRLLLEHHELYKLPEPSASEVRDVFDLLAISEQPTGPEEATSSGPSTGVGSQSSSRKVIWLDFLERSVWGSHDGSHEPFERDLVTLSGGQTDKFTTFLREKVIEFIFQMWLNKQERQNTGKEEKLYRDESIRRVASVVTNIVSSILPTISIYVLYFIHRTIWRLVFVTLWATVFSFALSFFTNASRVEFSPPLLPWLGFKL